MARDSRESSEYRNIDMAVAPSRGVREAPLRFSIAMAMAGMLHMYMHGTQSHAGGAAVHAPRVSDTAARLFMM